MDGIESKKKELEPRQAFFSLSGPVCWKWGGGKER